MMELIPVKDVKEEVKFWLDALNNPNLSEENRKLLNECLSMELRLAIKPMITYKGGFDIDKY
jgi:hypothetical protein